VEVRFKYNLLFPTEPINGPTTPGRSESEISPAAHDAPFPAKETSPEAVPVASFTIEPKALRRHFNPEQPPFLLVDLLDGSTTTIRSLNVAGVVGRWNVEEM
jgi:hypothetical protein